MRISDWSSDVCSSDLLAPDRHGSGTNAIALMAAAPFEFAFGENSLALHRTTSGRRAAIVRRLGLSLDVDTPDDLDAAIAAGFSMPNRSEERRGGKECVRTCRSRWSPYH